MLPQNKIQLKNKIIHQQSKIKLKKKSAIARASLLGIILPFVHLDRPRVRRRLPQAGRLQNLLDELLESDLHAFFGLRARLNEQHRVLAGEFESLVLAHLSICLIYLVSDEHLHHIGLIGECIKLVQPGVEFFERITT